MNQRVVITGLGVVAPHAISKEPLWELVVNNKSAIGKLQRFDAGSLQCSIAGEVDHFTPDDYMDRKSSRRMDRSAQLGVAAARLACQDAQLDLSTTDLSRVGVFEGTSLGPLNCTLRNHRNYITEGCRRANPSLLMSSMMGAGSGFIALELGVHGPSITIADGSASSTYAIGQAYRSIQHGQITIALAGGAEDPLSQELFATFSCAHLLSTHIDRPANAMRPFDKERDGFVLSEGSAFLILEELTHAVGRGAHVYGLWGSVRRPTHFIRPHPTQRARGSRGRWRWRWRKAKSHPKTFNT
jgi:3-oxoacyl-[acyl-carrier-protein] synthase II